MTIYVIYSFFSYEFSPYTIKVTRLKVFGFSYEFTHTRIWLSHRLLRHHFNNILTENGTSDPFSLYVSYQAI